MNREELKFIELYIQITQNGTIIPYESKMYDVVSNIKFYSNYLERWTSFAEYYKRKLEEGYGEWLNRLTSLEDVARLDVHAASNFPSEQIKISWGNDKDLAIEIKSIFEKFMAEMRRICKNTNISAYYSIEKTGYTVSAYSFSEKDIKCKNQVSKIFTATKKAVYAAVNTFNEAQGKGSKTKNILIKQPSYSDSAGSKDEKSEGGRGHVVSDDTQFEMSLHIDEFHVYREGKGGQVEASEIAKLFGVLPEEYDGIGPDA